jgi:hypothetical protein
VFESYETITRLLFVPVPLLKFERQLADSSSMVRREVST